MELVETRYPFDNFVEFISGGYGFGIPGLHLTIAFIIVFIGGVITARQPGQTLVTTMSMLYFALQPFNNPAFTMAGITIADMCGIYVAIACIGNFFVSGIKLNRFVMAFVAFTVLAAIHGSVVWTMDRVFAEQANIAARLVIVARTGIFPLVFSWIYTTQDPVAYFKRLVSVISGFTIAICFVYILQIIVFFSGTIPYGTFAGAGFSTTVAFGGVSIERGHLSRFMAPLLVPLFVHGFLVKRYWPIVLYFMIMTINFSASGLSFIAIQLLIATVLFWTRLQPLLLSARGIVAAVAGIIVVSTFGQAYSTIIDKIYRLVVLGDESDGGGRSASLMLRYLNSYPFGIGYSGSTFRTAPEMPEINMGVYAFITQVSAFSLIFIWLVVATVIILYFRYRNRSTVAKMLLVGSLALPFVFASDILWFGPLWWLPVFFLVSYRRTFITRSDPEWRSTDPPRLITTAGDTAPASRRSFAPS